MVISGHPDELKQFAATLKRISPKAFEYVRESLGLADATLPPQVGESKKSVQKKRQKVRGAAKSRRKVYEAEQVCLVCLVCIAPIGLWVCYPSF